MKNIKKYGLLCVVLVAMGCSQKSPSEYIEEAEVAIIEGEADKAVIVLKNALSSEPRNLKARYLLGSVYFQRGNAQSAEKELKIAFDGGFFKNEVLPIYLATLNFLQKDDEIIQLVERLTGLSNEAEAAAQTYKGLALFRKNETSRAKLAIKRATELAPTSPYSRLGRAHHALEDGETTDAIIILDELLADDPDFMQAVLLHGQTSAKLQNYADAISSFEAYIAQKPGDSQGNFLLIDTLIKDEQYEQAEQRLTPLLAKLPDNPSLNEFAGLLAFAEQDYAKAKVAMEQAISSGSTTSASRLVAGVASYQLNKFEQAHNHLSAIQSRLPDGHPGKRLYAEVQLRLGYSGEAASTLSNMGSYDLTDMRLITQTGLSLASQGNQRKAQNMLNMAKQMEAQTAAEKTRLGMLKLSLQDQSGYQDLIDALELNPAAVQARLALAQAYLNDGELQKAEQVAKQWVDAEPQQVAGYVLLAEIYSQSGQTDAADAAHQQALQIAPNNPASLSYFAQQAAENNDGEQALQLYKQAAENNPTYLQGLFNYLIEAQRLNSPLQEEALALIEQNYQQNQDDLQSKLNYARALVTQYDSQQAMQVLDTIEPAPNLPVFYWKGKADHYLVANKPSEALNIYSQWQQLEPNRAEPWLYAVVIQDRIRDFSGALNTVKRALNHHQDYGQLRVMEVHYTMLDGNVSLAQRLLDNLPDVLKTQTVVKGLQGQLHYGQGKFKAAIPLLQDYYQETGEGRFAIFIANAYRNLDQDDKGLAVLESHLQSTPQDLNVRTRLAERYMDSDIDKAIENYEIVLQTLPENIGVLNNLGWLHGQQGNLDKALSYAEQAVALRPENPKLLDTLGVVLLKKGEVERALEVSKKAFDLEPRNQIYRINFEKAQQANQ